MSKTTKRHKASLSWFITGIAAIVVLAVAIFLNIIHTNNTSTKIADSIEIDNGDLKINWDRYPTTNIELEETFTITNSGTYHLTGSLANGSIIVNAESSEVRLILDNVSISNMSGPAIYCVSAEDLVIELIGSNTVNDGDTYDASYDEDVDGAIYSKADLTFQGTGTLNIISNYQDAIVGKDDLKFVDGTYNIIATDDAIRGKDSVYIVNGNFTINSTSHAIKTTNATDADKGFVLIENGNLDIITAEGKGINSINDILIYNGNLTFNTRDDAIHSNNYLGITNGVITITSGDDGIHADRELIIDDGNITIDRAYEGLEAQVITINGGNVSIIANDDGINAGGGADASANNRPGAGAFDADENYIININGGTINVNAAGDGIDSNGWLYFNGGTTIVDGPTDNGNGALDAGSGIVLNNGEVIAIGSSGMAESLGTASPIYNISVYFNTKQLAGTLIEIRDADGSTIIEHTAAKTFNHLAAGASTFNVGESYTIYLNGEEYQTFVISSTTTTIGNGNVNFQNRK